MHAYMMIEEQSQENPNEIHFANELRRSSDAYAQLRRKYRLEGTGVSEAMFTHLHPGEIYNGVLKELASLQVEVEGLNRWEVDNLQGFQKRILMSQSFPLLLELKEVHLAAYVSLDGKGAISPEIGTAPEAIEP